MSLIDAPEVMAEYEADKAQTRTAAGSPTDFQGKAGNSDGSVRYTAPSVVFSRAADGLRLEAGGMQTIEAYDVLVANLDPTLERKAPPEDIVELFEHFSTGLTTQEVAALLTVGNDLPDRPGAERALIALAGEGRVERQPLGNDALWTLPGGQRAPQLIWRGVCQVGRRDSPVCRHFVFVREGGASGSVRRCQSDMRGLPPHGLVRCRGCAGLGASVTAGLLWLIAESRVPDRLCGPAPRPPEPGKCRVKD